MSKKKKQRTGLEWVEMMPNSTTKAKIKKNITKSTKTKMYTSLSKVLLVGFQWYFSPEGHDYWDRIHKRIVKQENKK